MPCSLGIQLYFTLRKKIRSFCRFSCLSSIQLYSSYTPQTGRLRRYLHLGWHLTLPETLRSLFVNNDKGAFI